MLVVSTATHAGQYCYLSFPQLSCAASHPFTISSAPGLLRGFNEEEEEDRALVNGGTDDDNDDNADDDSDASVPSSRMTFHIKGLGDFSNRVCDLVGRCVPATMLVRACVRASQNDHE